MKIQIKDVYVDQILTKSAKLFFFNFYAKVKSTCDIRTETLKLFCVSIFKNVFQ